MSRKLSKLPFEIEKSVEESTSLRKDLEQLKQEQEKKKEDYDRQGRIVEFLKEIFYMEAKQELVIFDVEPEERTEKWMQQLPDRVCKIYREIAERRTQNDAFALIQENFQKNKVYLHEYFPTIHTVFDDILVPESLGEFQVKRINITGKYRGVTIEFKKLVEKLISDVEEQARLLSISMNRMEKALKSSKFELLDWMDILESYFGRYF